MIQRRRLLALSAAAGVSAATGARAQSGLRETLDRADLALKGDGAQAALDMVRPFDPAGLSRVPRLEYRAVREGLEREVSAKSYADALALALGRAIDPAAGHRLAQDEVARLQARADGLLRGQGLTKGGVGERLGRLMADPRYLFSDDDQGRDQAVAEINARLAWIRPRLAEPFTGLTVAPAEARRMSRGDEARGKAGYRETGGGGEPGVYYVDLSQIRSRPRWTLAGVAYHELIPGHLLQLPLQARADPHPLRLRYAAAYFEAWAVYAEQLAFDLGACRGDPLAEIGALHWRLFRLGRVVADTGLHALGWSRERAVASLTEIQGPAIAFVGIEADVDRMIKSPGAYAAQGIGALDLARLRQGAPGGVAAFHRAVLADGPWPFGLLAELVGGRS